MASNLRSHFLLRPDVAFLNHGSFGACPRPVFDAYQAWQLELEREPVDFFVRRAPALLREARISLATYINCNPDDVVYVPNATFGVNIVARSLKLGAGDEVLGTDHEYGACNRTWRFLAAQRGFAYRMAAIPYPATTPENFVEQLFSQVSPATRVIFLSHITAPTALILPVAEVCRRAREMGIMTIVDGAHAPGQIPVDIEAIGADFYTGNLHKWLCAPKGAAFLHARRECQSLLDPLIVSWGWEAAVPGASPFIDHQEMWGTRDISATLAVPAAIQFQQEYNWDAVRAGCREMLMQARPLIAAAVDAEPCAPDSGDWFMQMSAFKLPPTINGPELHTRLFQEHSVEIPVFPWDAQTFMLRISVQGYNTWDDIQRLLEGLNTIMGR